MNKHLQIKITGKVQGIGFRFSAYEQFVELGLQGRAENGPERNVIIEVEGPEERVLQFIDWCHKGPSGARAEQVEVAEITEPFVPLKNG